MHLKLWKSIQLTSTAIVLGEFKTDIWKTKIRRKTIENMGLLLTGASNLVKMDKEEAETSLCLPYFDFYW